MPTITHNIKHHAKRAGLHLKDHFIPHERNNHRPHILKHRALLGYSLVLILLKVVVIGAPLALPSSSLYSSAITPKNIIDLTNQTRKNLGLTNLSTSDLLAQAAAEKAQNMLADQYFAHYSPNGKSPWDWIKGVGYRYRYAGENLAVHFYEAEDVQEGWMASPTHRANIVNPNYTQIGVGTATGSFEGVSATFVVQMFGNPVSTVAAAAVPEEVTPITVPPTPVVETINPTPVPEPEPGTVAGTETEPAGNLFVDETALFIVPSANGYHLRVVAENADRVGVNFGHNAIELNQTAEADAWEGDIELRAGDTPESGESAVLTASNSNGDFTSIPLAIVSPQGSTQKFFTFNEGSDKFVTFFGALKIGNLNDRVRSFYLGFIVFLAMALLINLFVVRLKIHHPSEITHAIAVIVLAVVLWTI